MLKSELIKVISCKTHLKLPDVEKLIDLVFHAITEELCEQGRVEIRGFGIFMVRKYGAYLGRNPLTGEKVQVAPKYGPFWKTGVPLRKRIDRIGKETHHDTQQE